MKLLSYTTIICLFLLSSCKSIEKMVDRGQYDEAIFFALGKMEGKKNKKTKHVQGVEEAFRKITKHDMDRVAFLKKQNRPEHASEIVSILENMEYRQSRISSFLPLISKDGYQARFDFVNVGPMIDDAMITAADYHLDRANLYLNTARKGSKRDARRAYDEAKKTQNYFKHYKNSENIIRESLDLGVDRILVNVQNRSNAILPNGFEKEILAIDISHLDEQWKKYYLAKPGNKKIDYHAELNIHRLDISPEREIINNYIDEKEIKDGWEYVLDKRGNVKKDSLGNDIKRERFVVIRAEVSEIFREKSALVEGNLELKNGNSRELIKRVPISITSVFEDYASSFRGDRRALCDKSRKRLKSVPIQFPTDFEMIWQSSEELKETFKSHLNGLRW